MIAKVTRGVDVGNLLRYLYGPGKRNEHTDPHIVAGYRHPAALEPARRANGKRNLRPLAEALRSPLETMRRSRPAAPVWQCSLRTAPTDRALTDEEWADVAEELMHQTGIAPRDDPDACRWIAVRHAKDHIHVVATLGREDGRRPNINRDFLKAREACQVVEQRYGLCRTAPADRTAAPRPSRPELERAQRAGLEEPPRVALRRHVAAVAAASDSEEAFFAGLRERGLAVRLRFSVRTPGEVTGYAVAVPDYSNSAGEPVFFSGGKLAADLTLPKLRHKWTDGAPRRPAAASRRWTPGSSADHEVRAAAYREAARAAGTAAWQMRSLHDPGVRADLAAAASDVLHTAADITGNRELAKAADAYDRAAREPYGRLPPVTPYGSALRAVARTLAITNVGWGDRREQKRDLTVDLLFLIANLADLIESAAEHRLAQQRLAQADAARRAAERLNAVRRTEPRSATSVPPRVAETLEEGRAMARLVAESFPVPLVDGLRSAATPAARPSQGPSHRKGAPGR
ncbi:relaxase/mobilization nuclease domain-containing protein [Actinomadura bangladeshensis]|uniref:Relaxase n=1 Tax=Actinomadura bangladeshensis TaxID=453573 RepID=A0A4R4P0Q3_9ACTN|nr:relaxase [Actinomadura bangladeshensis]TDC15084.1 relaxase [Actinomadura bangladeshensis]